MVTIPTIDQISGTTVMNKMRSLIHAFINFAGEMNTEIAVISTQANDAYDKAMEVAGDFADLEESVTSLTNDLHGNYYTKTAIDNMFSTYYTSAEVDALLANKQKKLTATAPIQIIQTAGQSTDSISFMYDNVTLKRDASAGFLHVPIDEQTIKYSMTNEKVYVPIDNDTLKYDSVRGVIYSEVNIDDETIKYDSTNGLYVPIDNDTIKYDATNGVIYSSGSYTEGVNILISNGAISEKGYTYYSMPTYSTLSNRIKTDITTNKLDVSMTVSYTDVYSLISGGSISNASNRFYLSPSMTALPNSAAPGDFSRGIGLMFVGSNVYNCKEIYGTDIQINCNILNMCDMDGTVIDSTNIANYISVSNDVGTVIKPFIILIEGKNGTNEIFKKSYVCVPTMTEIKDIIDTYFESNSIKSYYSGAIRMQCIGIYNQIASGSNFTAINNKLRWVFINKLDSIQGYYYTKERPPYIQN